MADEEKDNKTETTRSSRGHKELSLEDQQRARTSSKERVEASREALEAEREERMKPADIGAAPAEAVEAAGAIMEPEVKEAIDVDHPAVDNNPRAGTTEAQNRIDFNDPTQNDRDAVQERLDNQG